MDPQKYLTATKAKLVASSVVASVAVVEEYVLPDRGYFRARLTLQRTSVFDMGAGQAILDHEAHLLTPGEFRRNRSMNPIVLDIPGEVLLALKVPSAEAGAALRMAAAVKLFELGQLSSGAAARLAGVPRVVFLSRLADYGVETFRLTEEELERETRLA